MKRKTLIRKITALCLACFILITPLTINAVDYSVNEDGAVMAGLPESHRIYTIYTQSGRAFDVMNEQLGENSTVWTYPYNGDKCQEWRFIKQGSYYAIQDTNSQKYLTVLNNSSAENAQIVISSKPTAGFSTGQLFSVQQIGTSMRYRIFSKSSNNTLAIGYDSSYYLRQMATSQTSTQIYFEESAPYHGLQEGYVHIQEYNTTYTSGNQFLGFDIDYNALDYTQYDNSTKFEWNIEYYGGGYFIISLGDYYLWSSGTDVSTTGTFSENYCLWKIINWGNYYQFVPKTAISGENYSVVLGIDNNTPQLVQSTDSTGSWRIIRSHYYYNYDMAIYASEDYLHDELYSSHADVFDYACSSLYVKGLDNQKLIFNLGIPQYDQDAISDLICKSRLFILRAHGSPSSFCLNARDANEVYIGTEVNYNISSIESMGSTALSNLYCALYFSCHSAEGAYNNSSSTNFVKAVINKGARSAIGFDGEVDCRKVTSFSSSFFTYLANNNGSLDVLAKDAFNATLAVTGDYYGENYSPYFYNGYVEIKID